MKKNIELGTWEKSQIAYIRKYRPKIYTVLRHVSASGMSRRISAYMIKDGGLVFLDGLIATMTGYKRHKTKEGLVVGGCGMDMGFHLVYSLSSAIFPDGFKLKKGEYGRNNDKSGFDKCGGYALKQEWI